MMMKTPVRRAIQAALAALTLATSGVTFCFADTPATPVTTTPPAAATLTLLPPQPLTPGAQVVTLWPQGSPALRAEPGYDRPEVFTLGGGHPPRVEAVVNIHNPSIEVHLAPPEKANGMAIILAAGGGNTTLNVGGEGTAIAEWLNSLGISAFIERYRLKPYSSTTDALADTQRSVRIIRARAKEWGVDPNRVGIMGFSAGGEQAAWAALKFDMGNPAAADPIDQQGCKPDFVALVYAGWQRMDLSSVPRNTPPAFITCAGIDDTFHARQSVEFYTALFNAGRPAELHIYGHGGHGGGISPRRGIPYGTWHQRFIEWITDLGMMKSAPHA